MAAAAKHLEISVQDQERIARRESHVEHIQSDVTDVKADVRKLSEKIDTEVRKLNEKIDALPVDGGEGWSGKLQRALSLAGLQ